ncbi:MAG TPA: hypothetical protein VMZ74_16205 [Ramlibacter sp.]|nr:hypothetical protein [Ramlibacter sp.]
MRFQPLAIAVAAIALLNSCASLAPFAPDMNARTPKLEGYGRSDIAITTKSAEARALFNDGVLQAYAFNESAAVRSFKAALAKDADCAMCAWGVAWQLGPNINDHDRDKVADAVKYVGYALAHLEGKTPRERALVESLALRYAHDSKKRETAPLTAERCAGQGAEQDKIHPLDEAYADVLRKLVVAYPDDPEILSLHAEAEIIATPGDNPWDKEGKPAGRLGAVADRLEKLLDKYPQHTGLNHYMVHVLDASSVAQRAVPAADRLAKLAPASPHLLHMPAHTYINVGRFDDAWRLNVAAVAADRNLSDTEKAQGFESSKDWRWHNGHFLWYSALVAGQEKVALDATDTLVEVMKGEDSNLAEYARSLRLVTLIRFERWDAVLAQPQPSGERGMAKAWYLFARGVAQARLGRGDEAKATFAELAPHAAQVREKNATRKRTVSMMDYSTARMEGELALSRGDMDAAVAAFSKAADAATNADSNEPPMLGDMARTMLGDLQAKAGRWADAEASYRKALAERPGHPQAQRGLREALAAQKKSA